MALAAADILVNRQQRLEYDIVMKAARKILRWVTGGLLVLAAFAVAFGQQTQANPETPVNPEDALLQGKPLFDPQAKAAIIHLDADVDDVMLKSIQRRVDIAAKAGCTMIVFEVDTFGGSVRSMMEISKLIKTLPTERKIHTVAWVHDKAISAGAVISVSCEDIVMSSQGTLGDCAPIVSFFGIVPVNMAHEERAKLTSPMIQELRATALQNHLDPILLEAMVDSSIEIHEMFNARTHELRYVDTAGREKLLAEEVPLPGGGKEHPWQFQRTVDDANSLLTVGAAEGLKMGLSKATIDNTQQLKAVLNIQGDLLPLEFNWAERATVFLTNIIIRFFLFVGLLVFGWLEFSHPGTMIFGIAAILCLVLLIGAPFLTGLAQIWEIALIVLGLAIVVADVLVFGGIGLLAIPGFLLMSVGLVASFVPPDPTGFHGDSLVAAEKGLGVLLGGTAMAVVAFYLLAKYLYITPGFNRLQLAPANARAAGATGSDGIRDSADRPAGDAVFVGAIGKAASDLRPSGQVRFGEHLVTVVSYGSFIPQGAEVIVLEIAGVRIVVKPHALAAQAGPAQPEETFP